MILPRFNFRLPSLVLGVALTLLMGSISAAQSGNPYAEHWTPTALDGSSDVIRPLPPLNDAADGSEQIPLGPSEILDEAERVVLEGQSSDIAAEIIIEEEPPGPPPSFWESSFELGLNGSEGNTQKFNFRFGWDLEHKRPGSTFTFEADYKKDQTDSLETANRLFSEARQEWEFGETPWSVFIHATADYDQFQEYDIRLAEDAGVGYKFWKGDTSKFLGRVGAGVSREFGGVDEETKPEASFGLEYEKKISDSQKLSASSEYFPQWEDFRDNRVTSKVEWEVMLDSPANLSLKFGIIDRYDSTPTGVAVHNDFDYSITLLWKL